MAFHANMASSFSLSSKTFLSDFRSNFLSLFSKQLFTRLDMHWSLWWWYQKVAPKSPHRSTKKKRSFSLERKSWVFSARGAFFDCFWGFAGFLHIVHTVAKSNFLSKNSILFIRHWIWILAPKLELFRGVDFLEQKVVFCHSVHQ